MTVDELALPSTRAVDELAFTAEVTECCGPGVQVEASFWGLLRIGDRPWQRHQGVAVGGRRGRDRFGL